MEKLILDTSGMEFQAVGEFEPRLDREGVQRRDKNGGPNTLLYAVKLVAWSDADTETILVTVAVEGVPPKLSRGQFVNVERLQAIPWVQNGNARVAYRARSVVPSNGAASKPAPSPSPN